MIDGQVCSRDELRPAGLEPATSALSGRCSASGISRPLCHLSYGRAGACACVCRCECSRTYAERLRHGSRILRRRRVWHNLKPGRGAPPVPPMNQVNEPRRRQHGEQQARRLVAELDGPGLHQTVRVERDVRRREVVIDPEERAVAGTTWLRREYLVSDPAARRRDTCGKRSRVLRRSCANCCTMERDATPTRAQPCFRVPRGWSIPSHERVVVRRHAGSSKCHRRERQENE